MWRQNSAVETKVCLLIALTFLCSCHFGASLGWPAAGRDALGKRDSPQQRDAERETANDKDGGKPHKGGVLPYGVVSGRDAPDAMTNSIHDDGRRPMEGPHVAWAGKVEGARGEAPGTGKGTGKGTGRESAIDRATDGAAARYMWELYERFSTDKYSHPRGNTIRTFKSINTGE